MIQKNVFHWVMTFFLLLFFQLKITAHEIRPAYLELRQTTDSSYAILWKIPKIENAIPKIQPIFPKGFTLKITSETSLNDAYIRRYEGIFKSSLTGKSIQIKGLETTLIDVLLRVDLQNNITHSFLLQADQPKIIIPLTANSWQVARLYTLLGIEHILIGIDHLLFIFGLLLLVKGVKPLFLTITAFTLAHSITLAIAALGWAKVPQQPVEAVIALSIVFLAREYLMTLKQEKSLTADSPWLVAFIFGLLHGFGFAGALSEIGLPQNAIPTALFTFNIGVEIGQLIFVTAIFTVIFILKKLPIKIPELLPKVMAYALGAIAMFWLFERL